MHEQFFFHLNKIANSEILLVIQYPKGLGKTVGDLDVSHAKGVFDKTRFTMFIPPVEKLVQELCGGDLKHIVLFGVEVFILYKFNFY